MQSAGAGTLLPGHAVNGASILADEPEPFTASWRQINFLHYESFTKVIEKQHVHVFNEHSSGTQFFKEEATTKAKKPSQHEAAPARAAQS